MNAKLENHNTEEYMDYPWLYGSTMSVVSPITHSARVANKIAALTCQIGIVPHN